MSSVFASTIASSLKATLEKIIDDPKDDIEAKAIYKQWLDVRTMTDAWEEDLEMGGTGLLSEKPEGEEMATGNIREGYPTRYIARTFAQKLIVSEEAMEDTKYPQVIDAARRLKRAGWKTVDIETTMMLVRGFNALYTYGDGQPLWSNAHTLPQGGTFSNVMGTPASPSESSVVEATTQIRKYPDHSGIIEGYEPKRIVHPVEQWATWSRILKSTFGPVTQNFAAINVVNNDLDLKLVCNKYWTNTSTQWAVQTDAPDQPNIRWRRRFRSRTWMENSQELMNYGISARWARGNSDPRAWLGVEAS